MTDSEGTDNEIVAEDLGEDLSLDEEHRQCHRREHGGHQSPRFDDLEAEAKAYKGLILRQTCIRFGSGSLDVGRCWSRSTFTLERIAPPPRR
jgi:ribosomal protein L44E